MKVIGITGGIGSGKSTVTRLLNEQYRLSMIDADELSRRAAQRDDVISDVREAFGEDCLFSAGEIDRKKLAEIVFQAEEKKKRLNRIIHPRVFEEYESAVKAYRDAGEPAVLYDCPLLFEENLDADLDLTVLIYSKEEDRIQRIMKRSAMTRDEALARIHAQMPLEEKIPRADMVLYNTGTEEELAASIDTLYKEIAERVGL